MPTDLVRRLTASGWDWVVVESDGGGGGDLPAWWTLNNTPGAESVEFAGNVIVAPTAPFQPAGLGGLADMEIRGSGDPAQYATLVLWDPALDGVANVAVLEFGSAQGGTNNPGRLSNDGSAYFSTTIPTITPLEIDGAGSWGLGPQTAPYVTVGDADEFIIGPTGAVTISPSDDAVIPLHVSAMAGGEGVRIASAADPDDYQDVLRVFKGGGELNTDEILGLDTSGTLVLNFRDQFGSLSLVASAGVPQASEMLGVYGNGAAAIFKLDKNARPTIGTTTAPADADIAAGFLAMWFDKTNGAAKLMLKGKSANGTVVTGELALT